jgi:ubiquinone/menaquinone biosynthesis C-methylase UbiE
MSIQTMQDDAAAAAAKSKQHDQWVQFASGYSSVILETKTFMPQVHEKFVDALVPLLGNKGSQQEGDSCGPGCEILDVASASGEPALSLAAALPHARVIATDLAETYLPLGRARAESAGLTNVSFQVADGENLVGFDSDTFDAVTCSLGLMFFPREEQGLKEFYRVLKPGGIIALTVWPGEARVPMFLDTLEVAEEMNAKYFQSGQQAGNSQDQSSTTPTPVVSAMRFGDGQGLKAMMSEAVGFKDVQLEEFGVTFGIPSTEDQPDRWWTELLKTPMPLRGVMAEAAAANNVEVPKVAKATLQQRFERRGWLSPKGLRAPGNHCLFLIGRKPF